MSVLIGFEAKSIQSWIVAGGRLRDIAGASEIIERLCTDDLHGALVHCTLADPRPPDSHGDRPALKTGAGTVLSAAAGGFRLVIEDKTKARAFVRLWPLVVAERAPGLRFALAAVPERDSADARPPVDRLNDRLRADANGLPALPGSSIAGVLRHALAALSGDNGEVEALFGAPIRPGSTPETRAQGAGSRLTVSWAAIHDASDRPVDGLIVPGTPGDPVLAAARLGVLRDHVRIDHRGTAEDAGKFEERLVGAGHRFTFELELLGDEANERAWQRLLGLLKWPGLRCGAGTRRGFGAFRVVRIQARTFDLRQSGDFRHYADLPVSLGETAGLADVTETIPAVAAVPTATATLVGFRPAEPWVFGGGTPTDTEDIAPVTESLIEWQDGRGRKVERPVHYLPASSVKGVLAHRLAWHYNRLAERWADAEDLARTFDGAPTPDEAFDKARNPAVRALLGSVKAAGDGRTSKDGRQGGEQTPGRRGALLFDDAFLAGDPVPERTVMHVAIDRFTGGVRAGALFEERVLQPDTWRTDYRIVVVDPENALNGPGSPGVPADAGLIRKALRATLEDVAKGRLAFGAGGGRGNGGFVCDRVEWCETGREWLKEAGDCPAGNRGEAA